MKMFRQYKSLKQALTCLGAITLLSIVPNAGRADFTYVATHPHTSTQTARGKRLHDLQVFEGRIYAGYGDLVDNTGPLKFCYIDPPSTTFACDSFTFHTEEMGMLVLSITFDERHIDTSEPWENIEATVPFVKEGAITISIKGEKIGCNGTEFIDIYVRSLESCKTIDGPLRIQLEGKDET